MTCPSTWQLILKKERYVPVNRTLTDFQRQFRPLISHSSKVQRKSALRTFRTPSVDSMHYQERWLWHAYRAFDQGAATLLPQPEMVLSGSNDFSWTPVQIDREQGLHFGGGISLWPRS